METPRQKEIRETNERVARKNLMMVAKRKHEGRNRTTLAERSAWMKDMSNDGG